MQCNEYSKLIEVQPKATRNHQTKHHLIAQIAMHQNHMNTFSILTFIPYIIKHSNSYPLMTVW